jgi:mono/diheme cytochrome c family protein
MSKEALMQGRGVSRGNLPAGVLTFGAVLAVSAQAFAADAPAKQVTFSKDVAPIFQAKCQSCHQPNSIAPMSLISYQDARPWARSIRERVSTRQMPPWHIDPSVGVQKFKNDMSLTQDQIETIVKWVDGGALQGDPKDMPPAKPLQQDNEWQAVRDGYGPPDLVIKSEEYTMPAVSQDQWWRPMSDIPITEPRWVKLVEIRPSNLKARKIVHHSIAYLVLNNDPDAVSTGTATGGFGGNNQFDDLVNRRPQLMEWAIGKGYDLYRPGTGKLIVPGEKISWDQHIHAVGEAVTGGSEIGLWFYPKGQEPKKRSYLIGFTGIDRAKGLDIAPNSIGFTEGFTVLKENTLIENFQPHFHLRGKAMQVEAILPDGSRQIISYVGNFNFNWMTNYIYADDAAPAFPKGTVIHVSAWYDNTKANKNNPDPDQWVGFGDRTVDEMAHAWMNVTYLTDDEYQQWLAEHKSKTATTQNQQQ